MLIFMSSYLVSVLFFLCYKFKYLCIDENRLKYLPIGVLKWPIY